MKIVVVEDEYYAREQIIKIIKESGFSLEIAAVLEDGKETVKYLEKTSDVDIIITDIIMPELNGLELAGYVSRNLPNTQVIIVSGYEEFEYAKKAIEYEVKQYIIKPVNKKNILQALKKIMDKQEASKMELEDMIQKRLRKLPNSYLLSKQILENQSMLQIYLPCIMTSNILLCYRIIVIQLERTSTQEDTVLINKCLNRCFQKWTYDYFYCQLNDEFVVAVTNVNDMITDNLMTKETMDLLGLIRLQFNCKVTIGLSKAYTDKRQIYDAYRECLYAMNLRLLQGWNCVYEYKKTVCPGDFLKFSQENEFVNALQMNDYTRAEDILHMLLHNQELAETGDINGFYNLVLSILKIANKHYRTVYHNNDEMSEKVEIMFSRRYDLYSYKHLNELEEYLRGIIEAICNVDGSIRTLNGNIIIKDILHYVDRNYQYNLCLQELAEKKYFMNFSYLSRNFKSVVGKPFSRYVIELRLEKAKELLKNDKLKINDIAEQVGYNDVSHFIQSFKKMYRLTPEEYRNMQRQKS